MAGNTPLRVGIAGGGPAGLVLAINLAEWAKDKHKQLFNITVFDKRYAEVGGEITYGGSKNTGTRRAQVVTLQCDCLDFLSSATKEVLFKNVDERVWSEASRNIAIREVEDRLIERASQPEFRDLINLKPVDEERMSSSDFLKDFHVVVGADGAKSWVREHLFGLREQDLPSEGVDFALGIAFEIPAGHFEHGLPRPQALNTLLTVFQRRFLLNASAVERKGFLNMQVTREEYEQAVRMDGKPCTFGTSPGFVLEPHEPARAGGFFKPLHEFRNRHGRKDCDHSKSIRLWAAIRCGLCLFGIPEACVTSIIRIRLDVRYSPEIVKHLLDGRLACLCGDAAFQTHFWPGRGMNSVIKEAALLARCLFGTKFSGKPLRASMEEINVYEGFVTRLRQREHRDRSVHFLCTRRESEIKMHHRMEEISAESDWDLQLATFAEVEAARRKLLEHVDDWFKRLRGRVPGMQDVDEQKVLNTVRSILEEFCIFEIFMAEKSQPWPAAPGDEVLPTMEIQRLDKLDSETQNLCLCPAAPGDEVLPTSEIQRLAENWEATGRETANNVFRQRHIQDTLKTYLPTNGSYASSGEELVLVFLGELWRSTCQRFATQDMPKRKDSLELAQENQIATLMSVTARLMSLRELSLRWAESEPSVRSHAEKTLLDANTKQFVPDLGIFVARVLVVSDQVRQATTKGVVKEFNARNVRWNMDQLDFKIVASVYYFAGVLNHGGSAAGTDSAAARQKEHMTNLIRVHGCEQFVSQLIFDRYPSCAEGGA